MSGIPLCKYGIVCKYKEECKFQHLESIKSLWKEQQLAKIENVLCYKTILCKDGHLCKKIHCTFAHRLYALNGYPTKKFDGWCTKCNQLYHLNIHCDLVQELKNTPSKAVHTKCESFKSNIDDYCTQCHRLLLNNSQCRFNHTNGIK